MFGCTPHSSTPPTHTGGGPREHDEIGLIIKIKFTNFDIVSRVITLRVNGLHVEVSSSRKLIIWRGVISSPSRCTNQLPDFFSLAGIHWYESSERNFVVLKKSNGTPFFCAEIDSPRIRETSSDDLVDILRA